MSILMSILYWHKWIILDYIYIIYDANIGSINDHHWHHIWSMDLKLITIIGVIFLGKSRGFTMGFTIKFIEASCDFSSPIPRGVDP